VNLKWKFIIFLLYNNNNNNLYILICHIKEQMEDDTEKSLKSIKTKATKKASYSGSVSSSRPSRSSTLNKDSSYITQVDILYGKRDDGKFVKLVLIYTVLINLFFY